MVRSFTPEVVARELLQDMLELSLKAPTAGNSRGTNFLAIDEVAEVEKFWKISLSDEKRKKFPWPNLLKAPVIVLALTEPKRYINRYSEPDKASKLGASKSGENKSDEKNAARNPKEWNVPYWLVDTGFAIQNLLLATHAQNLGALFFGIFSNETEIKSHFKIPPEVEIVGALAIGHIDSKTERPSKSLLRPKPKLNEVLHFNRYIAQDCLEEK